VRVAVIGTGHVGLVTCVTFSHIGHEVAGVDADSEKIAALQRGEAPFFEPGMQELLGEGIASGRLMFGINPADVLPGAEIVFICVGSGAPGGLGSSPGPQGPTLQRHASTLAAGGGAETVRVVGAFRLAS